MIYASQGRLIYPAGFVAIFYIAGGFLYYFSNNCKRCISFFVFIVMILFLYYVKEYVLKVAYSV